MPFSNLFSTRWAKIHASPSSSKVRLIWPGKSFLHRKITSIVPDLRFLIVAMFGGPHITGVNGLLVIIRVVTHFSTPIIGRFQWD